MTAAPFGRLLVVGAGLLGTSVALAVRRRWPDVHLTAMDVVPGAHAPFDRHLAADDTLPDADLTVLACPVDAFAAWMPRLAARGTGAPLTDVGSVKRLPRTLAAEAGLTEYAGGHPMAGGTTAGHTHAAATLFDGRPWAITPNGASDRTVGLAAALAAGCGARVVVTDADAHDAAVAATSHLPQVVASALMLAVSAAAGDDALALSGAGLRDTTRLAESRSAMWSPILAANADRIAPLLRDLAARLEGAAAGLADPAATARLVDDARRARRRLPPV
ncbi:MAG: prephenate dehydrogenase/arogenate dehydrogenase family protein [Vicinamibacterales bacterium]